MRDIAKLVLGTILAVALFVWVLKGVGAAALWAAIVHASWSLLLLSAVLQFGHNAFRIARWRLLLAPVRPAVPIRPMFTAVTLGYMVTWVIPGRLGELVRPALLSAKEDVPLGPCMGTVLIDRIFDGVAILLLFSVGIFVTPFSGSAAEYAGAIRGGAITAVAVLVVPLLLLIGLSLRAAALETRFGDRGGVVAWFVRAAVSFARGSEALHRPGRLAAVLVHSLAAWFTVTLGVWAGVRAAGVDIPFGGVLVMQPMLAIGIAIPTPGGAGGFHAVATFALTGLFGIAKTDAVVAAILVHLAGVVPVLVVGAMLLWIEGLTMADLRRAAKGIQDLGRTTASGSPVEDVS